MGRSGDLWIAVPQAPVVVESWISAVNRILDPRLAVSGPTKRHDSA
jgi:hypothetical protein